MANRVLIVTDRIGRGNDELGALLMKNFLYSLARADKQPEAIMLMNEGVRLACEGSEAIDSLTMLAESGVPVKVCGTCLDFLGLKDSIAIGDVGTMPAAVEALVEGEVLTIA